MPVADAPFATLSSAPVFVNDTGLFPEPSVGDARIRMLCPFDIAVRPEFGKRRYVSAHGKPSCFDAYILRQKAI